MKEKYPSVEAETFIFFITAIFAIIALLGPDIYHSIHNAESGQNSDYNSIVPDPGTAEYEAFCKQFAEEHGREYGVNDHLIAMKNGGFFIIGYFGAVFGFYLLCHTIWEVGVWTEDRTAYLNHETNEPPRPKKEQIRRTVFSLIFVIIFCGLYFVAPYGMMPIP